MVQLRNLSAFLSKYKEHILHISYFVLTRFFAVIAFFVAVPFFLKNASESEYAIVAIGMSLLGVATVLEVAFGYVVMQTVGRQYVRRKSLNQQSILDGLFTIYLLLSVATSLIGFFLTLFNDISNSERVNYTAIFFMLPALCVSGVTSAVLRAHNKLIFISLSRLIFDISKAIALVLSAYFSHDALLVGPVLLLFSYFRAYIDLKQLSRTLHIDIRLVRFQKIFRYWRVARHAIASFGVVTLTMFITIGDKVLIKHFLGPSAVTYYSVAYDISSKAYIFVSAINFAMYSVILHKYTEGKSISKPVTTSLLAVLLLSVFYFLPLFIFASEILAYWTNESISENSTDLVKVMTVASFFYLVGNVFEYSITAAGKAILVLRLYLIGLFIYGLSISIAITMKSLIWFMYSYLIFCIVFCISCMYEYLKITVKIKAYEINN